jgi:hypothetical protein
MQVASQNFVAFSGKALQLKLEILSAGALP